MSKKSVILRLIVFAVVIATAIVFAPTNDTAKVIVVLGLIVVLISPKWGIVATMSAFTVFWLLSFLELLPAPDDNGFWLNIVIGAITNLITGLIVFAVQLLWEKRQRAEQKAEERGDQFRSLIFQINSGSHDSALSAIAELRRHPGWIEASLDKIYWIRVDLRRVRLCSANLKEANMSCANLQEADLTDAILRGADLSGAQLQEAILINASLWEANLSCADLKGANLSHTNLCGANLTNATLNEASLFYTQFDGSTKLPDGTLWAPDTDMSRFTNPS